MQKTKFFSKSKVGFLFFLVFYVVFVFFVFFGFLVYNLKNYLKKKKKIISIYFILQCIYKHKIVITVTKNH